MKSKQFPKDIPLQFWTHVQHDIVDWKKFNGSRLDLLHPSMYWDRVDGVNNIIVHPDPYNFLDYMSSHAYY